MMGFDCKQLSTPDRDSIILNLTMTLFDPFFVLMGIFGNKLWLLSIQKVDLVFTLSVGVCLFVYLKSVEYIIGGIIFPLIPDSTF